MVVGLGADGFAGDDFFFVPVKQVTHQAAGFRRGFAFQSGPFHPGLVEVCAQGDFLAFIGRIPAIVIIRNPDLSLFPLAGAADHARWEVAVFRFFVAHDSAHF